MPLVQVTAVESNPDVRTGRHVVYNRHVYLVFVTKYRRSAFTDAMHARCEEIMCEVYNKVQLSKLVNFLKGVSARLLRKECDAHVRRYLWGGHFWSGITPDHAAERP
ncbi:IS200/IS605 family transposase [Streptomyces coacervatus]|uniref:IS200/IS605 family transposase n=1 Tax=Streptomyces coacervatus TaxID=647381 RepID=A0ABP7GTW8_9ACTN